MSAPCNTCIFGPKDNLRHHYCKVQEELVRFYNGCPKHISLEFSYSKNSNNSADLLTDEQLFEALGKRGYNFGFEGEDYE